MKGYYELILNFALFVTQVIDINDDGFCTLMKDDGTTREDLTITEFCNPPSKEAAKAMMDKLDGEQAVLVRALTTPLLYSFYVWL